MSRGLLQVTVAAVDHGRVNQDVGYVGFEGPVGRVDVDGHVRAPFLQIF